MRNKINDDLRETTHSEFELMGYFSTDPNFKKSLCSAVGILHFKNGIAKIKMLPTILKLESNGRTSFVENNNDSVIYGFLEDGTYIKLKIFENTKRHSLNTGIKTGYYSSYVTDFSRFQFLDLENSKYLVVTFDALNEYCSFIGSRPIDAKTRSEKSKIGENKNFNFYLEARYYSKNSGWSFNKQKYVALNIEFKSKSKNNQQLVFKFIHKFKNFMSIIDDSRINVTSIRWLNSAKQIRSLRLPYGINTERNGKKDYSKLYNFYLTFDNFKSKLPSIINNIDKSSDKFDNLVKNYLYNIDNELNIDSALINYTNSIDTYMAGSKYQNGKEIENLVNKFRFWIQELPLNLYFLFFDKSKKDNNDEIRNKFIQSIVDTRDFLTHDEKANSEYLLTNENKREYVLFFRKIIHVYILYKYGVPSDQIYKLYRFDDIKNLIADNR